MRACLFATMFAPVILRHRDPQGILPRKGRKASFSRSSNCSIAADEPFRTSGSCAKRTSPSPPSEGCKSGRAAALGRAGGPQLRPNVRVIVGETGRGGARAGSKPSDRLERNMQSKARQAMQAHMRTVRGTNICIGLACVRCANAEPSPPPSLRPFSPFTHPFTTRFVFLHPFTRNA